MNREDVDDLISFVKLTALNEDSEETQKRVERSIFMWCNSYLRNRWLDAAKDIQSLSLQEQNPPNRADIELLLSRLKELK